MYIYTRIVGAYGPLVLYTAMGLVGPLGIPIKIVLYFWDSVFYNLQIILHLTAVFIYIFRAIFVYFYPWFLEVEPWVFRGTFSSPSSPPSSYSHLQLGALELEQVPARGVCVWGGGGYGTVDHGSCAEYTLLFISVYLSCVCKGSHHIRKLIICGHCM